MFETKKKNMEGTEQTVLNNDYLKATDQEQQEQQRLLQPTCTVENDSIILHRDTQPRQASSVRKVCIMLSCMMQLFLCNGIGYGLAVMYAEIIVVFDAKRADAALVQSLNMGLSAGAGILYAGVIRKYGPGICIAVATVTSSIGLFVSAFANGVTFIIFFTGIVTGLGMCVNYLASFVTITFIFYEDPGFFLISMTSGTSLGQFIVPFLYELFISEYAWSGAFILLSGVSLNCLPFALFIHSSRDFFYKGNKEQQRASTASAFCDMTLLTDYVIWILWINFLFLAISANVEAWFIVDHAVSIGLSRKSGSMMVSAIGLGNLFGRITGSTIRFKCTKTPTIYHWLYIFVLLAIIHLLITSLQDFQLLLLGCFLIGVTMGTAAAQAPAIMYEASGLDRYPQAMAVVNVMYGIGEFVSAVVGGVIKDTFGDYDLVFYIASGMSVYVAISTAFVAFIMRRRKQRETAPETNGNLNIKYKTLKQ